VEDKTNAYKVLALKPAVLDAPWMIAKQKKNYLTFRQQASYI
jgi:hypothetical protein